MNSGHLISVEANAMCTTRQVLMMLALMQVISLAHADDTNVPKPTPDQAKHPLPRIDYLSAGFLAQREKSDSAETPPSDKSNAAEMKAIGPNATTANGLHWAKGDQHPALEYRLSNDSAMRLRLGRHGAALSLGIKF